jgi:hypothetical protein
MSIITRRQAIGTAAMSATGIALAGTITPAAAQGAGGRRCYSFTPNWVSAHTIAR